jgi:DNA (cytosine-5)-methyltransferase 1
MFKHLSAMNTESTEPVLLVPSYLTKSAYAILVENNFVPRTWHKEGRYGSRTHKIDSKRNGIPLINSTEKVGVILDLIQKRNQGVDIAELEEELTIRMQNLIKLISTPQVDLVFNTPATSNKIPRPEIFDATVHPEKIPKDFSQRLHEFIQYQIEHKQYTSNGQLNTVEGKQCFTFSELFSGIGGFGIALERLGGKCVFASEIYKPAIDIYESNLDTKYLKNNKVSGDIWKVKVEDVPKHDLLVGGFPCQPFTSLGLQLGLNDDKIISGRCARIEGENYQNSDQGRGQLFTQIVRILRHVQPKAFLLENVPGLVTTDDGKALETILVALKNAGYTVSHEICSARGITAQSRKRLFIVGVLIENSKYASPFEFPFIPDLQLRAGDVLHTSEDLESASVSPEILGIPNNILSIVDISSMFRLSDSQMDQLCHRSKSWKPAKLAWDNTTCDTIDSHYGITIGKGNSQLVPSLAPHHPRRFTPRECARIMGFPNCFKLGNLSPKYSEKQKHENDSAFYSFIKEQYFMLGNAVCPPLIAVLGGAILNHIIIDEHDWSDIGLWSGINLAFESISPVMVEEICRRMSLYDLSK